MTYFQAIVLGLVQGLAEFLPISSSGHLALLQNFFGISSENVLPFTVLLHLGTLISVFFIYWRDIVELIVELIATIRDIFTGRSLRINSTPTRRLGFLIIVATIPTALIGLLFEDYFEKLYMSIAGIACGLIFTGIILIIADRMGIGSRDFMQMKFSRAVFVGIMQGIAICPGVSRSGSTLFGSLLSGLDRKLAVKFAFLISIPSILGSVVMEAPDAFKGGMDAALAGPVIAGVIVAALSGIFAIKAMIRIVSNKRLIGFSIYVWVIATAILTYAVIIS